MTNKHSSKSLKFKNLLWKLHYSLEKTNIPTNIERLSNDPRYRATTFKHILTNSENEDTIALTKKIIEQEKALGIHFELLNSNISTDNDNFEKPTDNIKSNQKKMLPLLSFALFIILAFIGSIYYLTPSSPESGSGIAVQQQTIQPTPAVALASEQSQKISPSIAATGSIEKNITTILRLHGSNTIGEKLAPALLEAYLTNLGAKNIKTTALNGLEKKIEAYLPTQGWVEIEVHAHGSSTAFKDLDKGVTDMGMSSRKIKDNEVLLLKDRYGDLTRPVSEHVLGLDGIAVIVNKANPINHLNSEQLAALFSGQITNWSQLGGDDIDVSIYSREKNSGTWDTFKNLVLKKHNKKLSPLASRHESSSELSDLVSQNIGAIGFIGLPYVRSSKLLAVSDAAGAQAIIPTLFTVGTEDYPLSRRLFFYAPAKQSKFMSDFINYAQSNNGQDIVKDIGFISQNLYTLTPSIPNTAPYEYKELTKNSQRLSLNFRFHTGSNTLDNKSLQDIKRLTQYASKNPGKQIMLFGFSDSIGSEGANLELSLKRALHVQNQLQQHGLFAQTIRGFGEAMPVASNMNKAGRNKNRRVEIWIQS